MGRRRLKAGACLAALVVVTGCGSTIQVRQALTSGTALPGATPGAGTTGNVLGSAPGTTGAGQTGRSSPQQPGGGGFGTTGQTSGGGATSGTSTSGTGPRASVPGIVGGKVKL